MAMSQYAYGKLGVYELAGKQTEYPCGFDEEGKMTYDPGAVLKTKRIMPTGYWKGSGLALALDLAGTMMSCGKCTHEISEPRDGSCGGCTQIFITYDPNLFGDYEEVLKKTEARVAAVNAAHPSDPSRPVQWPGEGTIYLYQEMKFMSPVFVEQDYNAVFEVVELDEVKHRGTIKCTLQDADGKVAIAGTAKLLNAERF